MSFCRAMAVCGFYEETDYAYSNALGFLRIQEPETEQFDYADGIGGELYQEVEEAMTQTLYLQLVFTAIYNPEKFYGFVGKNGGYDFAINMLNDLKQINDQEEFELFLDSIKDA